MLQEQKLKKQDKSYKYIVMGSDMASRLSALLLARQYQGQVLHIDEPNSLGSFSGESHRVDHDSMESLNYFRQEDRFWAEELSDILGFNYEEAFEDLSQGPMTFEEGKFKSFLGFGDSRESPNIEGYSHFASSHSVWLKLSQSQVLDRISELYQGDKMSSCHVTSLMVTDRQVSGVIINGSQRIDSEVVVFCGSPKRVLELLPEEHQDLLAPRVRQKLSKMKRWSSLHYTLQMEQEFTGKRNIFYLMSAKKEDPICLGRFYQWGESSKSYASWMTIVEQEMWDDPEALGNTLKYMKKQIKRAFPELLQNLTKEYIYLESDSFGHLDMEWKRPGHLPQLEGFVLAGPQCSEKLGWSGVLASVKLFAQYPTS